MPSGSDNVFSWADLLGKSVSMGRKVDYNKFAYSAFVDSGAQTEVDAFMQSALDVAKNAVMSSEGQAVSWDKAGLHLRKYADEPQGGEMFDPEQIWAINNCIVMTDDNWNTTRTAISNGHIIADVIVGRLLVGQSLQITATKADGTTLTFKVNGEGVFISNGSLVIEPLNTEDESNGVEIHPGKGKGLIITHKNNKFRVVLNADRGLVFQRQEIGSGDWTDVDEPVFIDTKGNAVLGGDIHARRLYLQEIGGENILTYIDQTSGRDPSYTNGFKDNGEIVNGETTEAPKVKLSGNYIEGRGLKAYDKDNNLRVHINGADGSLKMYNGYIEMQNSNGNELYIDPENFIKWIINGEKKFYYDTDTNALVFGGLLKTDSLQILDPDEDKAWFTITGNWSGSGAEINTHGHYLDITSTLFRYNGDNVATTADLSSLETRIKQWADSTFTKNASPIV